MNVLFWIWGLVGLVANSANFLAQTGSIGVGTSAYLTVGMLYWIGGMVLFGVGALLTRPVTQTNRAEPGAAAGKDAVASDEFPNIHNGYPYRINSDRTVTAQTAQGPRTYRDWQAFWQAIN